MLLCVSCGCGGVAEIPLSGQRQAIVNGEAAEEGQFPNVGLLHGPGGNCTATLIGRQTILTAAHCDDDVEGMSYITPGSRSIRLKAFVPHPDFRPLDNEDNELPRADIALGYLEQQAEETPAALAEDPPERGEALILVGWGQTGSDAGDDGTQRWAENDVEEIEEDLFSIEDASWGEGITCQGDSGGPAFAERAGEQQVMGVHASTTCYDSSWWFFDASAAHEVRVDVYFDWIAERIDDPEVLAEEPERTVHGPTDPVDRPARSADAEQEAPRSAETFRDPFAGARGCGLAGPAHPASAWWILVLWAWAGGRRRSRR